MEEEWGITQDRLQKVAAWYVQYVEDLKLSRLDKVAEQIRLEKRKIKNGKEIDDQCIGVFKGHIHDWVQRVMGYNISLKEVREFLQQVGREERRGLMLRRIWRMRLRMVLWRWWWWR